MERWNGEVKRIERGAVSAGRTWYGEVKERGNGEAYGEIPYCTGSDYAGSDDVTRVNYEIMEDRYILDERFVFAHGGYRTYSVLVRLVEKDGAYFIDDDIAELVEGLEKYPLIDEERSERRVMDREDEDFKGWIKDDFFRALRRLFEDDRTMEGFQDEWERIEGGIDDREARLLYERGKEKGNLQYYCEGGNTWYVDVERCSGSIGWRDIVECVKMRKRDRELIRLWELAREVHGSGIDERWRVVETRRRIGVGNEYHLMDDNGYYMGWIPFTVWVDKGKGKWTVSYHGVSTRYTERIRDYVEDMVAEVIGP